MFCTGEPFEGKNVKILLPRARDFFRAHAGKAAPRYLQFVYQPIKDEGGNVTSIFVEGLALTDRRATEEALRELNADLERWVIERTQARGLTWQWIPDLLGALDAEGYFETSNPAWKTILPHGVTIRQSNTANMGAHRWDHRSQTKMAQTVCIADGSNIAYLMQDWKVPAAVAFFEVT